MFTLKRKFIAVILMLCLVNMFVGCKDDPEPPPDPDMNGTWKAPYSGIMFTLHLTQNQGDVSGTGNVTNGTETIPFDLITGTCEYPNVNLTFSTPGYQQMSFIGSFSNENIVPGTLNGSGFENESITFTRQLTY